MWLAFALLGALAGGVTLGWGGALFGALAGAAVGRAQREPASGAREAQALVDELRAEVRALGERLAEVETTLRRTGGARRTDVSPAPTALGPGFTAPLWTPPEGPTIDPTAPFGRAMRLNEPDLAPPPGAFEPVGAPILPAGAHGLEHERQAREALTDDEIFGGAGATSAASTAPLASAASAAEPAPAAARAVPPPPPPSMPASPTMPTMPEWIGRIAAWFAGGNPVVRIGIAVLFFGFAFLVKYAYERLQIPIELRLSAVAAVAIGLLGLGFRLRTKRPDYGLVLQGGGIALLYLTVFGAIRIWNVVPLAAGFTLLAAVAAAGAALAVMQSSLALAVAGIAGGFLAPILASSGSGNHVALFAYYAVLNLGIVAIARYRAWRVLNLLGFAFTFVIATAWGVMRYSGALYASTQPFLLLFVALYVAIALLYARNEAPRLRHYVDGTLVFGVPIVGFGLQAGLVQDFEYGAAVSALVAALAYVGLATLVYKREGARLAMLVEAFLAIAIVFATLAIPLGLDGRWTAAAWALEGAALVWVGVRQSRLLARAVGYALQAFAGFALLADFDAADGPLPFADALFLGTMLIAAAGIVTALVTRSARDRLSPAERWVAEIAAAWGCGWLAVGLGHDAIEHAPRLHRTHALGVVGAGLALALTRAARRLDWPFLGRLALGSGLVLAGILGLDLLALDHPFAGLGWIVWPLLFATHYWILRRADSDAALAPVRPWLHAATLWLAVAVLGWEAGWQVDDWVDGSSVWGLVGSIALPAFTLLALVRLAPDARWPIGPYRAAYLYSGGFPIAALLTVWLVFVNFVTSGSAKPLPYVPILNPLDLAQLAVGCSIVLWLNALERFELASPRSARPAVYWGALVGVAFLFANAVLVRTLHHWGGVPFDAHALVASKLVQASVSILWTALALAATVVATRLRSRALWVAGAALLALVVAKLVLVDLSGGVERIVSFIVVGALMLVIGYFAPLPPREMPVEEH